MLSDAFINILSEEETDEYHYRRISADFLKTNISGFKQQFYLCGRHPMMDAVLKQLTKLGVDKSKITKEEF